MSYKTPKKNNTNMESIAIAVMDYNSASVTVYSNVSLAENNDENVEAFIADKGHHLSECYYMYGSNISMSIQEQE